MTTVKRWTPNFIHETGRSSELFMSITVSTTITLALFLLLFVRLKKFGAHYTVHAAAWTAMQALILAETPLDEIRRVPDQVPSDVPNFNQVSGPSSIRSPNLTASKASVLAQKLLAEVSRFLEEELGHLLSDTKVSILRRRIQRKQKRGKWSDILFSGAFNRSSAASWVSQDDCLFAAIQTVADLLVSDPFVEELSGLAKGKIGDHRFCLNFERLLQRYTIGLETDAKSRWHLQAVRLVDRSSMSIAFVVLDLLYQLDTLPKCGGDIPNLHKDQVRSFLQDG